MTADILGALLTFPKPSALAFDTSASCRVRVEEEVPFTDKNPSCSAVTWDNRFRQPPKAPGQQPGALSLKLGTTNTLSLIGIIWFESKQVFLKLLIRFLA